MLMVTIVSAIAISGETSAIVFERSARFSSTSCMGCVLLVETASAHQQTELFAGGFRSRERRRQVAVEHHGDPVGDLSEFVEVLAGHENGGADRRKVEQGLAGDGGRAPGHPPGRVAHPPHGRVSPAFAAPSGFSPLGSRKAEWYT